MRWSLHNQDISRHGIDYVTNLQVSVPCKAEYIGLKDISVLENYSHICKLNCGNVFTKVHTGQKDELRLIDSVCLFGTSE